MITNTQNVNSNKKNDKSTSYLFVYFFKFITKVFYYVNCIILFDDDLNKYYKNKIISVNFNSFHQKLIFLLWN